jgi:hypothetical protein
VKGGVVRGMYRAYTILFCRLVYQRQPNPVWGYSVRGVYPLLMSHDSVHLDQVEDFIWHKHVPSKISIFVWRLFHDRFPTKANLVARNIISLDAHFCVFGCGGVKSTHHLFFSCITFGSFWSLVRSWIGVLLANCNNFLLILFNLFRGRWIVCATLLFTAYLAPLCLCGMNAIIDYSKIKRITYLGC